MDVEYLYKNWAKLSFLAAFFMIILLIFNSRVPIGSYEWLFWLNIPFYFIHQFEEYVYPGGFIDEMNKTLERFGDNMMTARDTFFINVLFTWILMPLFNILGAISLIFPLIVLATATINPFLHVIGCIRARAYSPGLIAGLVLNLPLGLFVFISIILNYPNLIFPLVIVIIIGAIIHMAVLVPIIIKIVRKNES